MSISEQLYELEPDLPDVSGAVMLQHFTGFVDAGAAGKGVIDHLFDELDHRVIARFDTDVLTDYRGRRPTMMFETDHWESYDEPELALHLLYDLKQDPFLVLSGREPDLLWERFTSSVLDLIDELGVSKVIGFHGIPMGTPHTRSLGITAHATRRGLLEVESPWTPSRLRVPANIAALIEYRLGESDRDALGFAVHVPHYLAESTYPAASLTILEAITRTSGLDFPTSLMEETARAVDDEVDEQVQSSKEITEIVEALEQQHDMFTDSRTEQNLLTGDDIELPTAEEIGNEFERFLAEQNRPE